MKNVTLLFFALGYALFVSAQTKGTIDLLAIATKKAEGLQLRTNSWREQLHQYPELGNREFKTAKLVAEHLRSLGIEVKEGVAKTGW